MSGAGPTILWFRRDLRVAEHPALTAAVARGAPVIPLFIRDESVDGLGAAPKWRLGEALRVFGEDLLRRGSRLILRSGPPGRVLADLVAETDAGAIFWTRLHDPRRRAVDAELVERFRADGVDARAFPGHLLFEPETVSTGAGGYYKVFTPMWRAVRNRAVSAVEPAPATVPAPEIWPAGEALPNWELGKAMRRGARVVAGHVIFGEAAARDRLKAFCSDALARYGTDRDFPARDGTSRLSAALSLGEIGPRTCWHTAMAAHQAGNPGGEPFLRELVWRDFAHHLMFHTPHLLTENWRDGWNGFRWRRDPDSSDFRAWQRGRTGVPFVDAAMREMQVTGTMHNRSRMIAASFLTKHLLIDWRLGMLWFEEHLVDWDPASNAMGWQWSAGTGPDSAPFFRIFNPEIQAKRFDPDGAYRRRWIAEGALMPSETALSYFDAVPQSWGLSPGDLYPEPVVDLAAGRKRALSAYEALG